MKNSLRLATVLSAILFFFSAIPPIASADDIGAPAELQAWSGWIKGRHQDWNCAKSGGNFVCIWPGSAKYRLSKSGGDFRLNVELLSEGLVPLSFSKELAPRDVEVRTSDGRLVEALLIQDGSDLGLKLNSGRYVISGRFTWDSLPLEIPVPQSYGLVEVELDNALSTQTARRIGSIIRIESRDESPATEQRSELSIDVFRKISDGSPLLISTILKFKVSGKGRSLDLGQVLPADTLPVRISSELPLSLSADGSLAVQLISGEFHVAIDAVAQQPVEALVLPSPAVAGWPSVEIWSWYGDAKFRAVELSGLTNVASALTELPDEWRTGSTYTVERGGTVGFKVLRRGEQLFTKQSLNLNKELWIDLSGSDYTVIDRFGGTMQQGFRMNVQPHVQISRASTKNEPLFVTKDPHSEALGIEVRNADVNIEAVSRIKREGSFSAVGWDQTVDSLSMTLHLPPSWELFAASGAQSTNGSWIGSWTLLDLFLVLLLGISFYKLFGRDLAVILVVALVLSHEQFQAPRIMFVHLAMLAGWRKLLGDSTSWVTTLCKGLIAITFCALVIESLTFGKLQFTQMLFPQLAAGTRYRTVLQEILVGLESNWLSWPIALVFFGYCGFALHRIFRATDLSAKILATFGYGLLGAVVIFFLSTILSVVGYRGMSSSYQSQNFESVQARDGASQEAEDLSSGPNVGIVRRGAKVASTTKVKEIDSEQKGTNYPSLISGAAIPSWRWKTHQIYVAGPVDSQQEIGLMLIPPWLTRIICGLRAFLALALLVLLYRVLEFPQPKRPTIRVMASLLALLTTFVTRTAHAEFPSESLLREYESRLESQRCSRKQCAVIDQMQLTLEGGRFNLTMRVSSDGVATVTIPGPIDILDSRRILVNGQPTFAMRRTADNFIEIKVPAGKSNLLVDGELPLRPAFALQFVDRPIALTFESKDWIQTGLLASGVIPDVLRLSEAVHANTAVTDVKPRAESRLSSWVVVRRRFEISESQSIHTHLRRIGDVSQGLIVKLPLLLGERITSASVSTENQQVVVSFPPGASEFSYHGLLPKSDSIELAAMSVSKVSEEWEVYCDPIYSCEFSGIAPSASVNGGVATKLWQPFPGDKVGIRIQQLQGISGNFVTIDSARHQVVAGMRQYDGTVNASLRITKESLISVTLSDSATVQSLALDGVQGKALVTGTGASVLVPPGNHSLDVRYLVSRSPSTLERVPSVTLSHPTHNLSTMLVPAQDRWVVWTGGVAWGPSVVFWGKLLIVCLITTVLAHFGFLGISIGAAVMLGIGLTSAPTFLLGVPLAWLGVLHVGGGYRESILRRSQIVSRVVVLSITTLALLVLYNIVETGLVLNPPMLIAGNGSTAGSLRWFVDHTEQELLRPWIISFPLWTWRAFSLIWASWLVVSLLSWLKRTFMVVRDLK